MAVPQALRDAGLSETEDTLYLLQEMPRREAGWHSDEAGGWFVLGFRHEDVWRGTGLMFKSSRWKIVRRVATGRGTWFRIRHVVFGSEMWVGSAHFDPGDTQAKHRANVEEHLSKLKPTLLPIVLAADINSPIRWDQTEQGDSRPFGKDGKTVGFLEAAASRELRVASPSALQFATPTSRPRQEGRAGRQIDCICYKGVTAPRLQIHEDTHKTLGTDHELLQVKIVLRTERLRRAHSTRPRVWTGGPPLIEGIDQEILKKMAKECTKPKPGASYRGPESVKQAVKRARTTGTSEDWKEVQNQRKKARRSWEMQRIREATSGN